MSLLSLTRFCIHARLVEISIYQFFAFCNGFASKKGQKVLSFDDFLPNLYQKSLIFCELGWSVIPLLGDARPPLAKAPALPTWKEFQSRLPSNAELKAWFLAQKQQGIGVILGSFSGIFVVDIDDPQRAQDFARLLPDLTETFTVRSGNRGLPHYYFRVPSYLSVRSQHAHGVEIRSDGQYVVAPDSVIGGRHWRIEKDVDLKIITEDDLKRLSAFLRLVPHESSEKISKTACSAILEASVDDSAVRKITAQGLKRYYRTQALKVGRNNALFAATRYARDCGWSQKQVERALIQTHVAHPALSQHIAETPQQRHREGLSTISSVFSQAPRTLLPETSNQLPNSVREALLVKKLDNVARIVDGLIMAGIEAGTQISASLAYSLLQAYGIGRNTIYNTFKLLLDACQPIFKPVIQNGEKPSPRTPQPQNANADKSLSDRTKQCLFGRVAKPGKIRGRHEQYYVMPTIDDLCALLDVKPSYSDRLEPEDVATPAKYREALHTALIKRAPGQYPRRWQAARLGISKDTCRRYERRAGICVQPTYVDWSLGWHNVDQIIPDEAPAGQFLQDEDGKRYPPILNLARWLLAKGRRLLYRQQDVNHYSVVDVASEIVPVAETTLSPLAVQNQNVTTGDISGLRRIPDKPLTLVAQTQKPEDLTASEKDALQSTCMPLRPTEKSSADEISISMDAHKPDCVERLYCQLSELNPQRALTRRRASQLVTDYGEVLVEQGLRILRSRRDIQNPSGFLIRWLQGRASHSKNDVQSGSVLDAEQQHATWLKALQESAYASYLVNADQVLEA